MLHLHQGDYGASYDGALATSSFDESEDLAMKHLSEMVLVEGAECAIHLRIYGPDVEERGGQDSFLQDVPQASFVYHRGPRSRAAHCVPAGSVPGFSTALQEV